ncbi:MAG: hypothetical protein ED559_00385 [Phycisphaera sp.]|nr:MAG: hypothetical protein ED559_00385 [Phycisphaera sp.]
MKAAPIQPGTLCTSCGYDLAGLQETGVCPECAQECSVTVKHYRSISQKHEPYLVICRGMRKLLNGYVVLAFGLLAVFFLRTLFNDAGIVLRIILFVSFFCITLSFALGILQIATPLPKHNDPSSTSGYSKLVWASIIGLVLSFLFVVPVLVFFNNLTSLALAYSAFPGILVMLIVGTAGIANNVTRHMGVHGLHTPLLIIVTAAFVVMCPVFWSAYAFEYADRNFRAKPLGLTGGEWQDIYILSVLALFVAHFLVTLAFWLKVRKRVKKLPASTTTPPTP